MRAFETQEQTLERLEQKRTHVASMRASETQEQTLERLEQKRTHVASMRASETHEQTLEMLEQKRVHVASMRSSETQEQTLERLEQNKMRITSMRAPETEEHVVINGVASSSVHVISGVPQGSVLGPLLFLIYIDGISMLKFSDGSTLSLCADDMLLYKVISSNADYIYLQHDIDRIQNWSSDNLMSFNVAKCKCMLIPHKTHMNYPSLTLSGVYL